MSTSISIDVIQLTFSLTRMVPATLGILKCGLAHADSHSPPGSRGAAGGLFFIYSREDGPITASHAKVFMPRKSETTLSSSSSLTQLHLVSYWASWANADSSSATFVSIQASLQSGAMLLSHARNISRFPPLHPAQHPPFLETASSSSQKIHVHPLSRNFGPMWAHCTSTFP